MVINTLTKSKATYFNLNTAYEATTMNETISKNVAPLFHVDHHMNYYHHNSS